MHLPSGESSVKFIYHNLRPFLKMSRKGRKILMEKMGFSSPGRDYTGRNPAFSGNFFHFFSAKLHNMGGQRHG